jgi:hypothetical protein
MSARLVTPPVTTSWPEAGIANARTGSDRQAARRRSLSVRERFMGDWLKYRVKGKLYQKEYGIA